MTTNFCTMRIFLMQKKIRENSNPKVVRKENLPVNVSTFSEKVSAKLKAVKPKKYFQIKLFLTPSFEQILNPLAIIFHNGKTQFKNLEANAAEFLKSV